MFVCLIGGKDSIFPPNFQTFCDFFAHHGAFMHRFPGRPSVLRYAWRRLRGVAEARRSRAEAAAFVCACVCVRATHSRGRKEDFIIIILYKKCAVLRVVLRVVVCVVGCVVNGSCALYLSGFCCVVGRVVIRAAVCAAERVAIWKSVWYQRDEPDAHLAPYVRKWLGDLRG